MNSYKSSIFNFDWMGDHAVYGLNGGTGHLMMVLYHQQLSGKIKGDK